MSKYTREQIQKARDKADDAAAKFGMSTNEERAWIDTFTEALGLDVQPEKPEPGTWHVVTGEGAYANQSAYVGGYGNLLVFTDNGDYDNLAAGMDWPALTPARVVPAELADAVERFVGEMSKLGSTDYEGRLEQAARLEVLGVDRDQFEAIWKATLRAQAAGDNAPAEPVELSDGSLVRAWNEAMDAEADTDLQWDRVTAWAFMGKGDRAVLRRFAQALIAKHGHGRVEVSREQVRAGVDSACSDLFFSDEFKDMLTTRLTAAVEASK